MSARKHDYVWLIVTWQLSVAAASIAEAQQSPAASSSSRDAPAQTPDVDPSTHPAQLTSGADNSASAPPPGTTPADAAAAQLEADLAAALAKDAPANSPGSPPPAASAQATSGNILNPDLSVIADFALAAYSQRDNLQAGAHDPARKGFNLQALELALGAAVDPYFRFDGIIVLNRSEVEIEEAFVTTLDLPWHLQARAGQFLTRFGRTNPTHPHTWDFVDQPFALSRVFGGEGSRGVGVELSWLSPLPWFLELVASGTSADGAETSRSFLGSSDRDVRTALDFLYVPSIKQFFALSDDWSLAWGVSGAFGPNDRGGTARSEVYGTDLYLKWRPANGTDMEALRVQLEVMYRRRNIASGTLQDANGFALAAMRFAQRWDAAVRYEYGTATLDTSGHVTSDDLDPLITGKRQRTSLALTHFPTEFSRLRVQGAVDLPDYLRKPIWSAMLSLEVAIGPHRPHPF
jgi:hypothetical protein